MESCSHSWINKRFNSLFLTLIYVCAWQHNTHTHTHTHVLSCWLSLENLNVSKFTFKPETKSSRPTGVTGGRSENSSIACNGLEVIKNITAGLIKTGHLVFPHRMDRSRVQITPLWQVERCHTSQWSSINMGVTELFIINEQMLCFCCMKENS